MELGNAGAVANAVAQGASLSHAGSASKESDKSSTDPQFGDVLQKIQAQYGAKAEKPREIKKTLGKDDFLRIMITQMQHQDPTNPFKAEQMAAEMAQFTSVEQMQNMNQSLKKMSEQHNPLEKLAMTNLIGKTVTVDSSRFPHTEGQNEALSFNLPSNAKHVQVALISETGETVLEKDLGAMKQGENTFSWDGLKSNRLPAKGGNYMFRIEAKDDSDHEINTDSERQGRVVGVSFEGAEPILLVGDAKTQAKVTMRNIVRIDGEGNAAIARKPAAGGNNFFTFQKGVGSVPIDAPAVASKEGGRGDASKAAETSGAKVAAMSGQNSPQESAQNSAEKGFPNGLEQ